MFFSNSDINLASSFSMLQKTYKTMFEKQLKIEETKRSGTKLEKNRIFIMAMLQTKGISGNLK